MKYFAAVVLFCLLPGYATGQVAKVSSQGTTVYYQDNEVYTPKENVKVANQPVQYTDVGSFESGQRQYEEKNVNDNTVNLQKMKNNPMLKMARGSLKNTEKQRTARNLLVVAEVAEYKLGDEKLQKDIEEVKVNREFLRKMDVIMKKLNNDKLSNNKNKEVLRILNDTGNRLYNLLAD